LKKNLIIARYNEDLKWISDTSFIMDKIYVYNKGSDLSISNEKLSYHKLENVGRECTTYLTFIVDFYDQFDKDDIYVFSQGNPFEHNRDFISQVNGLDIKSQFPVSLSKTYGTENTYAHMGTITDTVLPKGLPFKIYFHHLFISDLEDKHTINYHALWAVKGSSLLFRSKSFYEYCLKLVKNVNNPLEAHIFERLWQYIFDGETLDWFTHYDEYRSKFIGGDWRSHTIM